MINDDMDNATCAGGPPVEVPCSLFLSDRTDLCTKFRVILSCISYAAMACIRNDTVPLVSIWQGDLDISHT